MIYCVNINDEYFGRLKALKFPRKEFPQNKSLLLHMYGDGNRAPTKFNFQVYRRKDGAIKLIASDINLLESILKDAKEEKPLV